jgi:tetratricopeptide (TPR) repeat protein
MSEEFKWKAQPLFISSTFTDMMAERDVLRDFVFPELAERLRKRRIHLEPIDLRWGVESTDQKEQREKELLVLKVCLDEIDRCKPFLLGLIGDRYGWVPPEERMKAAEEEKGFISCIKNKSVTALEIEYGVFANKEQCRRSLFYFRDPLPYDAMPLEMAAEFSDMHNPELEKEFSKEQLKERLETYKDTIEKKVGKERVHHYDAVVSANNKIAGLDAFKERVLEELWSELDAETKEMEKERPKTWQEEERLNLEEFIVERTISFSGREDVIEHLKEFAFSAPGYENSGLCLAGESGSGKSAIFAKLYTELQKDNVILLAHAAGISLYSNSLDDMLTLWIEKLAKHLQTDITGQLGEKSKFDDRAKLFAELLSKAAINSRVVVLVDALNQFERTAHAKYVNWLPELLPENAKFIFTAIPGEETEHLAKHKGMLVEELKPITKKDAGEIVLAICQRYHKTLNEEAAEIVLSKQKGDGNYAFGNPLWLNMAVEEFLLLDEDDFAFMKSFEGTAGDKLKQLLITTANEMPAGIEDMYAYLFRKTGRRFGKEFVESILSYIAVTRNGLRERDLEELLNANNKAEKWDNLKFAALRRYLRGHIVKKGAESLWDFRHVQVRESINNYFLKESDRQKTLHKQIAAYLEKLPRNEPLRMSEILWHLFKADDIKKTAQIYGSCWWDTEETNTHSKTLKDILLENENNVTWIAGIPALEDIDESVKGCINNNYPFSLEDHIKDYIRSKQHKIIFLSVLNSALSVYKRNPDSAEYARDVSVSYNKAGDIYQTMGDTKSALVSYESSLQIAEELQKRNPDSAKYARDVSVSYNKVGDIYKTMGDTKRALAGYESSLQIAEELRKQNPDSAEYARDMSVSYNKVGDIYQVLGDTKRALASYESSLEIREELRKRNPDSADYARDVSVSYNKAGDIYKALGDTKRALASYESSLEIREELQKRNPGSADYARDMSVSYNKAGDIYQTMGDMKSALASYENSLQITEELRERNPDSSEYARNVSISYDRIGDIYKTMGDTKRALARYVSSLQIREELRERNPDSADYARDLSVSYNKVGDIYKALGDTKSALASYENSRQITEELLKRNPDSAEYARNLSISYNKVGDIYQALGDLKNALASYESSLQIVEELRKRNPDSAAYARDLSVSYNNVGDIYKALGDMKRALASYESSLEIRKELRQRNSGSAEYARDLSVSYNKVGDIYKALGDTKRSLARYENSLEIREELRKRNSGSAEYARDLSISYDRIGDIYKGVGDTKRSLAGYESSLEIREELRKRNPDSAEYLRDIIVSYYKLTVLYQQLDDSRLKEIYNKLGEALLYMKNKNMYMDPPLVQLLSLLLRMY